MKQRTRFGNAFRMILPRLFSVLEMRAPLFDEDADRLFLFLLERLNGGRQFLS